MFCIATTVYVQAPIPSLAQDGHAAALGREQRSRHRARHRRPLT